MHNRHSTDVVETSEIKFFYITENYHRIRVHLTFKNESLFYTNLTVGTSKKLVKKCLSYILSVCTYNYISIDEKYMNIYRHTR